MLTMSCTADDDSVRVENCGEITFLNAGQPTSSCQTGFSVSYIINGNIAKSECITESRFNDLVIGGQFCGSVNN